MPKDEKIPIPYDFPKDKMRFPEIPIEEQRKRCMSMDIGIYDDDGHLIGTTEEDWDVYTLEDFIQLGYSREELINNFHFTEEELLAVGL